MRVSTPTMAESEPDEELLPAESSIRSWLWGRGFGLALGASALLGVIGCVSYASSRSNLRAAETDNVLGFSDKNGVEWLDLGVGTACREGAHDHTLIPENGKTTTGVGGLDACKATCKATTCKGAEYRISEDRCELWYQKVGGHEHLFLENSVKGKPDFVCMLRQPTCTELRGHFSIFMSFVQDLNTYHEKHCKDGPSDDPEDKCSMKYARTVDQAAHDICDAIAATCNERSCYTEHHHVKSAH